MRRIENEQPTKLAPGVVRTVTVAESAVTNLQDAIGAAHRQIDELIEFVSPHMPRHLFDADNSACKEEAAPSRVPDYESSHSDIVNGVNRQTNEVDRLTLRIQFLRNNIVV